MNDEPLTDEQTDTPTTRAALELRRPDVPASLDELAVYKSEAVEIMEARGRVLATARTIMIRATFPTDYTLYKKPTGQVTAYLDDNGGDRVRDVLGIEIFDVSTPERITTNDPAVFHYVVTGSGRCKFTGQIIERVEGWRSSTDDVCKGKSGGELEKLVRKSARANLDGSITRTLSGLQNIPLAELETVWAAQTTTKRIADIPLGRGFGSFGQSPGNAPDVDPPICPHCKTPGVYRPAKGERPPFYGCPKYASHPQKKWFVDAAEWIEKQSKLTPAQAAGFTGVPTTPPSAEEIFGDDPGKRR
jgi:hypothetical protein